MKARIDNNICEVEIINAKYNEHAVEVKILNGIHKNRFCIVERTDLIIEKKQNRFYIQEIDFDCRTATWKWKLYAKAETEKEALKKVGGSLYNHAGDKIYRILDRELKEYI